MASSSSSAEAKVYDVFISHRGPDVKRTLAILLYDFLQRQGCNPFLDREEIERGASIISAIDEAIRSSRVQIAIFSKGFAESSWCLDELVLMLKQTKAVFIPVFYRVKPWELRHIDNDKSQYAKAFADYQSNCRNLDKLDGWKRALASAADISGFELDKYFGDLCDKIVCRVLQVLHGAKSTPLHVAKYPVGLDELVQDFERCCANTAKMVGILGPEGSGKSTLAKALFNKKSSAYYRSSFLSYAGRQEYNLQSQLLKDLFSIRVERDEERQLMVYLQQASHFNFLIVVDDIDDQPYNITALIPIDKLSSGSLVIFTTREERRLESVGARYEMKGMGESHAKDLFCSHAFGRRDPPTSYQKLVESFVKVCGGLPLLLIVLGAHVYEKDEHYWNLELEKLKKISPEDMEKNINKISFDGLDTEEKQIFIDIACCFNKRIIHDLKKKAITIWKLSGWSAENALHTLLDKCLIEINGDKFQMHDHLRDLGRQMADELGPPRLWQPELLRSMEANGFKKTLAKTRGRCFHSFHDSSLGRKITYFIANTDLVFLGIESGDKELRIPSWVPLQKLHYLSIHKVKDLWDSFHNISHIPSWIPLRKLLKTNTQATFELRKLHILGRCLLQELPKLMEQFSHLEELEIGGSLGTTDTTSLVQSLKQLSNLRSLNLRYVWGTLFRGNLDLSNGGDCPTSNRMDSLETIKLSSLNSIYKLVISEEMCPKLQTLEIISMDTLEEIELKSFIKVGDQISHLEHICISGCPELKRVKGVEELPGLKRVVIEVPANGNALARNYIGGLRRLVVKETILVQKPTQNTLLNLNSSLFYEVIDTEVVSEIERGHYTLKMESSSSAITIYVVLVTSEDFELTFPYFAIQYKGNRLITVVLNQHDSEGSLWYTNIKKGFKVIIKFGEEGKALIVLRRIVDQLYSECEN